MTQTTAPVESEGFRLGCLPILGIVGAAVLITALLTAWWVQHNFYASEFTPIELSATEQQVLDSKLSRLEVSAKQSGGSSFGQRTSSGGALTPEPYSEKGAEREILLNERELNSLVAKNPDMAERVAIDLADELVSVKLVIPMDEELLLFGGTTLRLNLGVQLSYAAGRPVVALQGVSIGGVPLPNAWLGGLKYKNLVEEFGSEDGFWKLFADGVQDIQIDDGQLRIQLKE